MMGSDFLTIMSVQPYYIYLLDTKMILRQKYVPAMIKSMNSDDVGLNNVDISNFNDVGLYTMNT